MKLYTIFASLLLLFCVVAVDESKFKKCNQSGFCQRHRSKATKLYVSIVFSCHFQYVIDPSSVTISDNKVIAGLIPSRVQPSDLELVATILPNDLIRVHIVEKTPLEGRVRFEADEVLISGLVCSFLFHYRVYKGRGFSSG